MKITKLVASSVALLSVALLVGCGNMSSGSSSSEKVAKKNAEGIYSPTVTITTAKQLDENAGKYAKGDDLNTNPFIKLGVKDKGIKIKTTLLGGDAGNYNTKLRLALTGSESLPDVFPVYDTQMASDMIDSGKVKAINGDIEKYMPERLKKIYRQFPNTMSPVTRDGKIYGISIAPAYTEGEVMIIRQDWLDKLHLKAPRTIDELQKVMDAFTNDDPDGNGKKDTFGLTFSGKDGYATGWVADSQTIFTAFTGNQIMNSWQKDSNGQLAYGSIASGNKEGLAKMAEWHKKGYLYPEGGATAAWDAMKPFNEGKAGIIFGRPWVVDSLADVKTVDKKAKVVAYSNLQQQGSDKLAMQQAQVNDGYFMFNKDFKNMAAFFDYYNWLYGPAFGDKGFKYGYMENYDYDIVKGKPEYDSTKYEPAKATVMAPDKVAITKNAPQIGYVAKAYYDIEKGVKPTTGPLFRAQWTFANRPDTAKGYAISYEDRANLVPNQFTGAPTKSMKQKWDQLQTLEKTTYNNIVYGRQSVDSFDAFVKKWKAQGGDDITKEVNQWYKSAAKSRSEILDNLK
ncbi:hypothetical protein [Schleiferilactobacillus harbinensis]|uniref:hypothetical protein n=1 Tax=Schleiferilactobacillus harbinensis TaxID=304207 RepID=UPI00345E1747